MIRTQVLLTPDLSYAVREIAEEKGESISAVVRQLLDKALTLTKKRKKTGVDFLLKLSDNAFKGAPKDLSTNDEYLYGLP